jgi:hypothetical protein
MKKNDSYIAQKFRNGVGIMNWGDDPLPVRVRRAWEEIVIVLDPEDFKDRELRDDFEYIASKREFCVIEGVCPKISDDEAAEVKRRIEKIETALKSNEG